MMQFLLLLVNLTIPNDTLSLTQSFNSLVNVKNNRSFCFVSLSWVDNTNTNTKHTGIKETQENEMKEKEEDEEKEQKEEKKKRAKTLFIYISSSYLLLRPVHSLPTCLHSHNAHAIFFVCVTISCIFSTCKRLATCRWSQLLVCKCVCVCTCQVEFC